MKEIEHMTKQMTMSDRVRAAWTNGLRWESAQAPGAGDAPETEKVCLEPADDPTTQTCTTPDEPAAPPIAVDAAA
jgi:hypothetical protein